MKTIKLSNCEVDIKESMSWGAGEEINGVLMSGADIKSESDFSFNGGVLLEAKFKALELLVVKIRDGKKEFDFSRDWMNELSKEDGDKLFDAVDDVAQVIKKKQ